MRTPSTGDASPPDDAREPNGRGKPPHARGRTSATVQGQSAPRLPHERDESSDSGTRAPSEVMRRAHDDVASGKTSTDKSEGTDSVYRRNLRSPTPGSERD